MAIGYQYRWCKNFPDFHDPNKVYILDPQSVIIGDEFRPAHSKIAFHSKIQYGDYTKFRVIHETERKIRVRFEERLVDTVIEQIEFPIYLARDRSHVFAATKDVHCDELLTRVRNTYPEFEFHQREIDLKRVEEESSQKISGAWFGKLQTPDLSAAAIFGSEVSESDEWERYLQLGTLTSLHLTFIYGPSNYKVAISKKGGIVIFNNLTEEVQIELVDTISRSLEQFTIDRTVKGL